jgi:hypothetical protein
VKPYVKHLLALSCPSIHLSTLNNSVSSGWILLYYSTFLCVIDLILIHYVLW